MDTLQAIFNNREIAIGFWVMVSGIALLFVKSARKPLKEIIILLLSRKFIAFYLVFAGFLFLVLAFLKWVGFWNINLLKDTVFWVLFVEFPIFVKTIEKAKDSRFFGSLIKENIALSVIIEFFVGFWTFSLWVEIILIPITIFFSLVYALSEREKKHQPVKKFFDRLTVLWGLIILITAIQRFFQDPEGFINVETLKSFLLPIVLLLLNLISFNFTFDIQRIKEIATYIFSTLLVFSASLLVFSIGFRKKQLEDISQIKKYALYELLSSVKKQESQLIEYPPIDDPSILYVSYVLNAFEVKESCNKVLAAYSNLLTTQERDAVKQLQLYTNSFFSDLGIHEDNIKQYNVVSFSEFYNEKVRTAPQNEKINNFTYTVQRDLNKYSEQIKLFRNEFKQCY